MSCDEVAVAVGGCETYTLVGADEDEAEVARDSGYDFSCGEFECDDACVKGSVCFDGDFVDEGLFACVSCGIDGVLSCGYTNPSELLVVGGDDCAL